MRMLYIDESYDNEIISLAGVYLPDIKYRSFNESIEKFISSLSKFPKNTEMHADHIWNGRADFSGITMDERAKISDAIAKYIGDSKLSKLLISISQLQQFSKETAYLQNLQKIVQMGAKLTSKAGNTQKQLLLVFDERSDINQKIHNKLLEERRSITSKYVSSCAFIDAGYEGISKFSRLLQIADFVAFWSRLSKTVLDNPTLFRSADDSRKVELVRNIESYWKHKQIIL